MKHLIDDGATMGMSAALLWHFSNIWRYGQYMVGEPNLVIRSLETVLFLAVFVWGATRFMSRLIK